MRRGPYKFLPVVLVLALAAACGGSSDPASFAAELRDQASSNVRPPSRVDAQRQQESGLVLETNSPSLQAIAGTADVGGAAVLFVVPDGPSDGHDIEPGEVLVAVDGTTVTNHEHAFALLRTQSGQTRELTFAESDGSERSVRVEGGESVSPRLPLDRLVSENPRDPLVRYVRARFISAIEEGDAEENLERLRVVLEDLDVALEEEPEFAEAITLNANVTWDQRPFAADDEQRGQLERLAFTRWQNTLDLDPRHTSTLAVRAGAYIETGRPERGAADAERAIEIDGTHPRAHWSLARARVALGNLDEAAGPARAAVELNPFNNLFYYRTLATIFLDLDRASDCSATADAIAPWLEEHTGPDAGAFAAAADDLRAICNR